MTLRVELGTGENLGCTGRDGKAAIRGTNAGGLAGCGVRQEDLGTAPLVLELRGHLGGRGRCGSGGAPRGRDGWTARMASMAERTGQEGPSKGHSATSSNFQMSSWVQPVIFGYSVLIEDLDLRGQFQHRPRSPLDGSTIRVPVSQVRKPRHTAVRLCLSPAGERLAGSRGGAPRPASAS